MTGTPHLDPLELLTLPQLSQLVKRSRRALEMDIAAGKLRTVKLGGSTRVPRMEAERYVYGDPATVPCDDIKSPAPPRRPGHGTGGSSSHAPDTFTNGDTP